MNYDDFAKHPLTLGERRSDDTDDAKEWSPRDLLINILRDIDEGNLTITDMVVCYSEKGKKGGFYRAGPNPDTHISHIEIAKAQMIDSIRGF